ncbi:hypothetical protein [Candidatus Rhabdochlamydia porcellionis]|jgi:hypothetical protein|uniref:Uncharacterized protein n=1 Tax=Candidatus Rhabdochlamydia porcellionis TaxID=225148 RepID=A0ABX8YYR3_9BACT|nr:hypothetical protein [Candidatus Rhabdochlamydia porcellionis]QZA58476.1 hypothetical protein RHAB15C_0000350 [Candidatus Rhabdochlamydia porcellionis]
MTGLDENCLRNLKSSEILKQDFLRCDSKENINEPIYVNKPIHETIDELIIQALYSEPVDNKESVYSEPVNVTIDEPIYATIDGAIRIQKSNISNPQQKTELVSEKSLLTIEGSFKKRDAKNLQKIKDTTKILNVYSPDQVNFDVQFNLILNAFKNLKSSSSKLAAFLYILDSTKDKESPKIQINNKKIYKELPRKYKKLIKKSNPKFSLDMHSTESLKSIESIRAHLEKRSIFIKAELFLLKDQI